MQLVIFVKNNNHTLIVWRNVFDRYYIQETLVTDDQSVSYLSQHFQTRKDYPSWLWTGLTLYVDYISVEQKLQVFSLV